MWWKADRQLSELICRKPPSFIYFGGDSKAPTFCRLNPLRLILKEDGRSPRLIEKQYQTNQNPVRPAHFNRKGAKIGFSLLMVEKHKLASTNAL